MLNYYLYFYFTCYKNFLINFINLNCFTFFYLRFNNPFIIIKFKFFIFLTN